MPANDAERTPHLPLLPMDRRISEAKTRETSVADCNNCYIEYSWARRANMRGGNKIGRRIALILVFGMLGSFAVGATAFAQAGSTGGTIGKTDKSVGGESPPEPHAPASSRSKGQRPINKDASQSSEVSPAGKCARIVGTWNWVFGSGEVTAKSNGTYTYAVGGDSGVGKWSCSDGTHVVMRANGHEDRMTLSDDGMKMTGVSWVTNFTVPFSVHERQ